MRFISIIKFACDGLKSVNSSQITFIMLIWEQSSYTADRNQFIKPRNIFQNIKINFILYVSTNLRGESYEMPVRHLRAAQIRRRTARETMLATFICSMKLPSAPSATRLFMIFSCNLIVFVLVPNTAIKKTQKSKATFSS
jgi:hypothetical protein